MEYELYKYVYTSCNTRYLLDSAARASQTIVPGWDFLSMANWQSEFFCCAQERAVSLSSSKAQYAREGFFILPQVLLPSEADATLRHIMDHVRENGAHHANMMGGHKTGGWYIRDFPTISPLRSVLDMLRGKQLLQDALRDLLGESHRLLARSEIYIDRIGTWHMDACSDRCRILRL